VVVKINLSGDVVLRHRNKFTSIISFVKPTTRVVVVVVVFHYVNMIDVNYILMRLKFKIIYLSKLYSDSQTATTYHDILLISNSMEQSPS
jgi:hypothetical protein